MNTLRKYSTRQFTQTTILLNLKWKLMFLVGWIWFRLMWILFPLRAILRPVRNFVVASEEYAHCHHSFRRSKQAGRLSDSVVRQYASEQSEIGQSLLSRLKPKRWTVSLKDFDRNWSELVVSQRSALSIYRALTEYGNSVERIANIGSRMDVISSFNAEQFPDKKFISVDFQQNLSEINSFMMQRANWSFMSGYPLALLEQDRLRADMYVFQGTSVLINNAELNQYLDHICGHAKLIYFGEPWYAKLLSPNLFSVTMPEDVPPENPYCGGRFGNYHHNYIAKLEARDFEIVSSEMCDGDGRGFYFLKLLARKRNASV